MEKNSQQKPNSRHETKLIADPAEKVTTGHFSRKNEDEEEQFIYTDESILSKKESFVGKTVRITWRKEMFEQAGSGETFERKLLLKVDAVN